MTRPTIHDVARVAGVSLSTVDRVLNDREGVREKTRSRVMSAINSLGFERNIAAANLSRKRRYRLCFILPDGQNSFMRVLEEDVAEEAAAALRDFTVIETRKVPAFDAGALAELLRSLDPESVDGVAMVATDATIVRIAVRELRARGVAVVTLVSDLPGSEKQGFVGIDNVQAGRTAGSLLGRFCRGRTGRIAMVSGSMLLRDHAERRLGFEQVLRSEFPDQTIIAPLEGLDDKDRVRDQLAERLAQDPDIVGVYSLGAGNRGVAEALSGLPAGRDVSVVVHELTRFSREALLDGSFDAVLHQNSRREVQGAIELLRRLLDGEPQPALSEPIRVEIYMRDNLP
ncbi:transcriptional regulator, LacI family [Pseudooceanicola antarcticus]|uniref:LacI family transcriptional regulator n=1 Tax=Pseudooceanicola antarcticus TaxID=1247613 RepID=A0A285J8U0_9RHOB|nr:LacI family DNA-binding transcriptional regulator [Pseudooceanicola antarcticus]PJE26917.1 LacI family transcriptional regulator [Pseudooceanicola antarcticus]SNY55766.1 transcriptional regulator, LacI family [Pseudooceanicola antarcticus]